MSSHKTNRHARIDNYTDVHLNGFTVQKFKVTTAWRYKHVNEVVLMTISMYCNMKFKEQT